MLQKKRKILYKFPSSIIEKTFYDDSEVVLKSFPTKCFDGPDQFSNEIITFQILESQELSKRSPYIAEYIGFVLYESGPYFGSIVLKYYPLGDLADYCRNLNKSSCCARQNRNKPKEINQLVDFAKQIAEGD